MREDIVMKAAGKDVNQEMKVSLRYKINRDMKMDERKCKKWWDERQGMIGRGKREGMCNTV